MTTRTQVDLSMSSRLERIKKNPRRPVKDPFMQTLNFLKETSTRRNPVALLLRCWSLRNVNVSLVKAVMKDVSWISARWMMIQNQTIMCLFGDNTTFTFRRSDCDWKKASDKKFNRGLGKP